MHVDRQRSLEGVYGDSYVEDCEIHPRYYRKFSPKFYGSGLSQHMPRVCCHLMCYVSCSSPHPHDSRSACSRFLTDMVKAPLGPLVSCKWRGFLQNQLLPILCSDNATFDVDELLGDDGDVQSGDGPSDEGEIINCIPLAACYMQHVLHVICIMLHVSVVV